MFLQRSLRVAAAIASFALASSLAITTWAAERDAAAPTPPTATSWSERPLAVHGLFSFPGGPTGIAGAELDYSPSPRLGLTAGVGAGYVLSDNSWAPRYALGARYRFTFGKGFALGAGATFSTGRYLVDDSGFDDQRDYRDFMELPHALWAGPQLSLEWRAKGFSMKVLSGFELLLNGAAADCYRAEPQGSLPHEPMSCSNPGPGGPKSVFIAPVGLAFGYAF
jgi:hypothetical protein